MLYNLNLRSVTTSIKFFKSLIWWSFYLKIILSVPINSSLGVKCFFILNFINLNNLLSKEYISIEILIISYSDPSNL